jgi:hypothetical protein
MGIAFDLFAYLNFSIDHEPKARLQHQAYVIYHC